MNKAVKQIENAINLNKSCTGFEKVYELLADIIIKQNDQQSIITMCDTLNKPDLKQLIMGKIFDEFDKRFVAQITDLHK